MPHRSLLIAFLCATTILSASSKNDAPKWIRVSSGHFLVLTDAGEKKGREIVLRFEQLRSAFGQLLARNKLNFTEPVEIVAFGDEQQYLASAPVRNGRPIFEPGFLLRGEDRIYVVLNAADNDSWRAVSFPFARFLMDVNYPPAQAWFDEGFAGYFSSLRIDEKQALVGGAPQVDTRAAPGPSPQAQGPQGQFVDLLNSQPWLPIPQLFATPANRQGTSDMFRAESWMVMHYLLSKDNLSEAGTYLGLVQLQKLPIEEAVQKAFGMSAAQEEAVQKAFGMSAAQLEAAVKEHFQTISPQLRVLAPATPGGPFQSVAVPGPLDVGASVQELKGPEIQALLAEVAVRLPEHRKDAVQKLETLRDGATSENAIDHRALAWVDIEEKQYDKAIEELSSGLELDGKDSWSHYYSALARYKQARASGKTAQGLANTFQDLRFVIDWFPTFAEAYNMLAMARLDGGGVNSAIESMKVALQLAPRSDPYTFNMAQIQIAGKHWDEATSLLERLKNSADPDVQRNAKRDLADLPTLRKYGILPEHPAETAGPAPSHASATSKKTEPAQSDSDASSEEEPKSEATVKPDARPIKFAKGKLVDIDCTQSPLAVLTVLTGGRRVKLRTVDYSSLTLVGAEKFSCDWRERSVAVNYKASGPAGGDLVSLEVQ